MQAFSLKDFEFKLPTDVWDAAQDLHAAGAVRRLTEVEPKFWVAEVATADWHVEVEVLFAATKVRGFTCECRPGTARPRFCPHVAAVLLKLRQFYEKERRDRVKPPVATEKLPQKLTVPNILAAVEPEKLAAFVREYAQADPDFALALKTRFAAEVPGSAGFFAQLLDAVVGPCRQPKPRDSDFRRLMATLAGLDRQQSAAVAGEDWPAVFDIARQVAAKLGPLVAALPAPRSQHVGKHLAAAVRRLSAVGLRPGLAPGLEADAHAFFIEILEKGDVPPAIEAEVVDFFVEKSARPAPPAGLEVLLLEKADGPVFSQKLAAACLPRLGKQHLFLKIMEGRPFSEARQVAQFLAERGDWAAARDLCLFLKKTGQPRPHEDEFLDKLLFEIAEKTGDRTAQLAHLRGQFMATGNFLFYEKMRAAAPKKDWPAALESLLAELRQQPQTAVTRHRIAKILAEEGHTPVLAAYLEAEGDPELLAQHTDYFLKNAPAPFFRLAHRLLADHLREHFGRQPAERAREFLSLLFKKSPAETRQIAAQLLDEFWERASVAEEIAIFLTKEERRQLLERVELKLRD